MSFCKILSISYKNGNPKNCKFVKQFWEWIFKICNKKWYIIDSETKGRYSHHNPIKFLTGLLDSSLSDYSDAYILVTGHISVKRRDAADTADIELAAVTQVAFKNCAPFKDCRTEVNEIFLNYIDFINIAIPMYNLIEYSDKYSDTSRSLTEMR